MHSVPSLDPGQAEDLYVMLLRTATQEDNWALTFPMLPQWKVVRRSLSSMLQRQ